MERGRGGREGGDREGEREREAGRERGARAKPGNQLVYIQFSSYMPAEYHQLLRERATERFENCFEES